MTDYTDVQKYLELAQTSNDQWFKDRALKRAADEIEALRKANTDCVAWEKACKADLDKALARVAEVEGKYQELLAEKNFIGRKGLKALFLRKQAEAVEASHSHIMTTTYVKDNASALDEVRRVLDKFEDYANNLRQQADEAEKTGG